MIIIAKIYTTSDFIAFKRLMLMRMEAFYVNIDKIENDKRHREKSRQFLWMCGVFSIFLAIKNSIEWNSDVRYALQSNWMMKNSYIFFWWKIHFVYSIHSVLLVLARKIKLNVILCLAPTSLVQPKVFIWVCYIHTFFALYTVLNVIPNNAHSFSLWSKLFKLFVEKVFIKWLWLWSFAQVKQVFLRKISHSETMTPKNCVNVENCWLIGWSFISSPFEESYYILRSLFCFGSGNCTTQKMFGCVNTRAQNLFFHT